MQRKRFPRVETAMSFGDCCFKGCLSLHLMSTIKIPKSRVVIIARDTTHTQNIISQKFGSQSENIPISSIKFI
jgi:hypothetical protein